MLIYMYLNKDIKKSPFLDNAKDIFGIANI